ncbi:hypothetical protein PBY51_008163 [Eleginops maclovinus]|uniref:SAP domain-containing protein n=1 Tax=Eleginops maclovinus TaxID=56733 RepID=A0AAN7X5D8_ELEMC|nr:hypothetical protein PBY51_008163 [Eleginops maclovinus]
MLEHLPCIRIDPAPLRSQPISRDMEERALRFELERQACQSVRQVLQLKLQQRRSREEFINQRVMTPLKSSAAFHEQRRSLERARTEDYLKRKIRARPERSELIRMHILEETSAEPSLLAKQMQLKRTRLADDLNDKISHRPGPMELIHKNILPVHSSIKQAIIETQFPKASGDNSNSAGKQHPISDTGPYSCSALPPISGSPPSSKLTNGTVVLSAHRTWAPSHIKSHHKASSDRSAQRHKKPKDNKPKIKKLKYHQYIPPDQKGDKEPPPHLDSSYAKILQQQQLFLQLQILSQQQQHYNYHAILPAPPKSQTDQQPSSSSSSSNSTTSSPPRLASSTASSNQSRQTSGPLTGTRPASLPPNLDEMKVAELKSELKLRTLPVSGTKNDLIERLRSYQELNGGADTSSSPTAGGTTGPGAGGAAKASKSAANNNTSQQQFQFQSHQTSAMIANTPQHLMTRSGSISPQNDPLTPSDLSPGAISPDTSFPSDPLGEMMSSPLTPVKRCPAALATKIKEVPTFSPPAPYHFSIKLASLLKLSQITNPALALNLNKDRMLQEKDRQIEELTRMLRQNQRLVEVLKLQLEHRSKAAEPLALVRVKQEPPDKPSVPLSFRHTPSPLSREMGVVKQQSKQIQIQTKIHVKQRQPAQVSPASLHQQPGSAPSLPLDLFKRDSTPTLVTDGKGNHFLIALTNHITENQRTDAPGSKATNHIALQRLQSTPAKLPSHNTVQPPNAENHSKQHTGFLKQQETKNGGTQGPVVRQQDVAQCLSAPPSLQPFFNDQENSPSGKYALSPSSQTELCPSLDVLFSPLSPASIRTAASSPDNKETEHEEDFIDVILQTGGKLQQHGLIVVF